MKDLFIGLIDFLEGRGKITEALMYAGGDFSKIKIETKNGTYSFTVSKEKENDGNS